MNLYERLLLYGHLHRRSQRKCRLLKSENLGLSYQSWVFILFPLGMRVFVNITGDSLQESRMRVIRTSGLTRGEDVLEYGMRLLRLTRLEIGDLARPKLKTRTTLLYSIARSFSDADLIGKRRTECARHEKASVF